MKSVIKIVAFVAFSFSSVNQAETIKYVNGQWFNGENFINEVVYSEEGVLRREINGDVDDTVDLNNGWVIPPLAEAHIHSLNSPEKIEEQISHFMKKGIFYVMVQDSLFIVDEQIRSRLFTEKSPDVLYTTCPLTVPYYGVVRDLYKPFLKMGAFGENKKLSDIEGKNICFLESEQDIDLKINQSIAAGSDFIKVLLAFSEEQNARKNLPADSSVPTSGINPELLPEIVARAHARGVRVSAHVETAADVQVAAKAGVDFIAHLPGWRIGSAAGFEEGNLSPMVLSDDNAKLLKKNNVTLITTAFPKTFLSNYKDNIENLKILHSQNLKMLKKHGVSIAIGSDSQSQLVPAELDYIDNMKVFSNLELLKLAVENTPKTIFPNRKIGHLKDGYEANFIVLASNPLENLQAVEKLLFYVKNGKTTQLDSLNY